MDEARAFLSKQQPPPHRLLVPSHCSSPCCRIGSVPIGDVPGRTSRFLGAFNDASILLSGSVWPVTAGPRDHDAQFGRCDIPGGGTHLPGRFRRMRRTMPSYGHTPCPGSPETPSGRPGVRMSRSPPLRSATGRRPPAPARRWRNATAPPAACGPAPRCPASANARRGR